MKLPMAQAPAPVPMQTLRAPQETIPQTRPERERIMELVRGFVAELAPAMPISFEELRAHAARFREVHGTDEKYDDYIGVLINSEGWKEQLATVPFERRLLLLPKCLRVEDKCPAPFDEFGLLCKSCGLCSIQDLQEEAERLGYACLVAEGSALVMAMIETGQIEAIVGVSCLSVLEKAFPYTESAAIPAIAIPLLQDDCKDTNVDIEWVWDTIHLTSDDKTRRMDLEALKSEVQGWFSAESLAEVMRAEGDAEDDETLRLARDWMARAGKRWRPYLTVCAYKALTDPSAEAPADLRKLAIAVECFHKASLIHDDIEDGDDERYGEPTLHAEVGIPVALNVGDALLGEGYRLIAECEASSRARAEMLRLAALGHRQLSLGQGAELSWARDPQPLASLQVLDIFRRKTAPAFAVALRLGAALAGADASVHEVLERYSEAIGIAYQIRDDIDDLEGEAAPDDLAALRPTLLLALAHERARGADKAALERAWRRAEDAPDAAALKAQVVELAVVERARELLESYKEEAVRALVPLEQGHSSLKGLLRRVVGKIFRLEIKGWCDEFEARNAAGRPRLLEGAR